MASRPSASRLTRQLAAGQDHHRAGRLGEAERAYRDVLRHDATNPEALHLLGILAAQTGRLPLAIDFFTRALARDPDNAELHHRRAEAYRGLGDHERAHQAYLRAASLKDRHVEAIVDCAVSAEEAATKARERGDVAGEARWRKIAGEQLGRVGQLHAAVRSGARGEMAFRRALELDPDNPGISCNYADLLAQMGRMSEAEPLYRNAISLDPRLARAYNNLGSTLAEMGRKEEAEAAFRHALALAPDLEEAAYGLSSGALLGLCYRPDVTAEALFEAHRRWGAELVARQTETAADFPNDRDPERRLRVGYVSPDFRQHSVASFFEPLLALHDKLRFETYCYGEVAEPDAVTQRLKSLARHWRSTVGLSDTEFRRRVRDDRIDILIDLAGHTGHTRLPAFAVKPAPVTASWLGYPATSGLPTIDYRITDAVADPPGAADRQHTETLIRLSGCFLCYRPPAEAPPVAPPPCRERGWVTFGSFNNLAKVTPEVIETWGEILRAVPGGRLILKGKLFADGAFRQRYLEAFAARGVAIERIDLRPLIPGIAGHLRLYQEVDIGLDPFPYNGTTTTCEALWMGVPVVTLSGDRHGARVGASLLARVGLKDLVAESIGDYIAAAVALARDLDRLAMLRMQLRERVRASPLCDEPGFAHGFEAALREMWRRWCRSGGEAA